MDAQRLKHEAQQKLEAETRQRQQQQEQEQQQRQQQQRLQQQQQQQQLHAQPAPATTMQPAPVPTSSTEGVSPVGRLPTTTHVAPPQSAAPGQADAKGYGAWHGKRLCKIRMILNDRLAALVRSTADRRRRPTITGTVLLVSQICLRSLFCTRCAIAILVPQDSAPFSRRSFLRLGRTFCLPGRHRFERGSLGGMALPRPACELLRRTWTQPGQPAWSSCSKKRRATASRRPSSRRAVGSCELQVPWV